MRPWPTWRSREGGAERDGHANSTASTTGGSPWRSPIKVFGGFGVGLLIALAVTHLNSSSTPFMSSVDTMKESMDTAACSCMTDAEIADDVDTAASVGASYITVDTQMDYPGYQARWVSAIRKAGKHVWFRVHPNAWQGDNGTVANMSPSAYLAFEHNWIVTNPGLFRAGDILDASPEAENSPYWDSTYGAGWTSDAPNQATDAFNSFLIDVKLTADSALSQVGIHGVTTGVRSVNGFFAADPHALYPATIQQLGYLAVDAYPDQSTTDPSTASQSWLTLLQQIHTVRQVPIVIAEMGYSNRINVSDSTQANVVASELAAFKKLEYITGLNYWVGAGDADSGGYTHIFAGATGHWTLRPAAYSLRSYFATRG